MGFGGFAVALFLLGWGTRRFALRTTDNMLALRAHSLGVRWTIDEWPAASVADLAVKETGDPTTTRITVMTFHAPHHFWISAHTSAARAAIDAVLRRLRREV